MDVKFSDIFKRALTHEELSLLNKTDLVELVTVYQTRESLLNQALDGVMDLAEKLAEASLAISKRLFKMLDVFFSGSLKSKSTGKIRDKRPKKLPVRGKILPSARYPNVPVTDHELTTDPPPQCDCGHGMSDSGMWESSERLEVRPKQYHIIRHNQVTYTCNH